MEELLARQKRLEDVSRRHLFVKSDDVMLVTDAIGKTIERLSEMRILIRELEPSGQ